MKKLEKLREKALEIANTSDAKKYAWVRRWALGDDFVWDTIEELILSGWEEDSLNEFIKDFEEMEQYEMTKRNCAFETPLMDIIKEYKDGSEEALDGDEVDRLIEHLRNKINLQEGNITEEEYLKLEEKI